MRTTYDLAGRRLIVSFEVTGVDRDCDVPAGSIDDVAVTDADGSEADLDVLAQAGDFNSADALLGDIVATCALAADAAALDAAEDRAARSGAGL